VQPDLNLLPKRVGPPNGIMIR